MKKKDTHRKSPRKNLLYATEPGRWLTALLMSGLMLAAVFSIIHPVFMTIDDARLKYIYAGYSTGEPESLYLFSYYPISWLLSTLYRYFPKIQWYGIYQFALIGFSSAMLGKTLYKICWRRQIHFAAALVLHAVLYATVGLVSTILMHFEITAAIAGMAGVVLLLGISRDRDSKAAQRLDLILSVLLVTASFVIQFNAFYSVCCYLLVALVWLLLDAWKHHRLKKTAVQLTAYVLCLACLVVGIRVSDDMLKERRGWQEYRQYNKYRVPFWDYPHVTYEEDPELFESLGWSEEFYDLTQKMYFMDERFSEDNLSRIVEPFSWFDFEDPATMVSTMERTLRGLVRSEKLVKIQTAVMALMAGVLIWLSCSRRRWREFYPQLIALWCCTLGTAVLSAFLASRGRFPLRAWLAVMIPCISVTALLLISTRQRLQVHSRLRTCAGAAALCTVMALWSVSMAGCYRHMIETDWTWRTTNNTLVTMMEDYVCRHPENVYVYDHAGAQNYCVFSIYPDPGYRPSNAFVWGSSYLYTPPYYDQLERSGRTGLQTPDFFDDNVYFITQTGGPYQPLLLEFLESEYRGVEAEVVDCISDYFTIYKFRHDSTGG